MRGRWQAYVGQKVKFDLTVQFAGVTSGVSGRFPFSSAQDVLLILKPKTRQRSHTPVV